VHPIQYALLPSPRVRLAAACLLFACSSGTPKEPPRAVGSSAPAPTDAAPAIAEVPVPPDAAPPAPDADPRAPRIELTFMGDIMFGGQFNGHWSDEPWDEHDPLELIAPAIRADLALANLETTVTDVLPQDVEGDLRFAATPAQVAYLPKNGITAVTLANNHLADFDLPGLEETPGKVRDLGLLVVGAPRAEEPLFRVETLEVKGWRIGVIAATTKNNRARKRQLTVPFVKDHDDLGDLIEPVVAAARPDHDLVIVVLHWGVQYDDEPSKWQVKAAHRFVDAGADAVIGHHPHVLQGIERYGKGVIAYSLGNFVFQNGEPRVRDTGVLRLGFALEGRCLDLVRFDPAIEKRSPVHHPKPATGKAADEVLSRLEKYSAKKPLSTTWTRDGDRGLTAPECPRRH